MSPYGYGQQPQQPQKSNGFAIAALVLGIAALCLGLIPILGFIAFPLGIVGLVLGVIGIVNARKRSRSGKAMAIIGTVLCVLALVLAVIGVIIVNRAFIYQGDSLDEITRERTEQILQDDLDVALGQFLPAANPLLETAKLPVTLRNKGRDSASFSVHVEAVDAACNRIADDTAHANLSPGQSITKDLFVVVPLDQYDAMRRAAIRIVEVAKY
jgi:Domain of unknown function (DUF4190)